MIEQYYRIGLVCGLYNNDLLSGVLNFQCTNKIFLLVFANCIRVCSGKLNVVAKWKPKSLKVLGEGMSSWFISKILVGLCHFCASMLHLGAWNLICQDLQHKSSDSIVFFTLSSMTVRSPGQKVYKISISSANSIGMPCPMMGKMSSMYSRYTNGPIGLS